MSNSIFSRGMYYMSSMGMRMRIVTPPTSLESEVAATECEMNPEIWRNLPEHLIHQVLRYLPWWSKMQLRRTSTSWNTLLSSTKFLAGCPPSDPRAKPCFTCLTLIQSCEDKSTLVYLACCLTSDTYDPEDEPSGWSRYGELSVWRKWHGRTPFMLPSPDFPVCCDLSVEVDGTSHPTLAPVSGIFVSTTVCQTGSILVLMNPFNSTSRRCPPVPPLQRRCTLQSSCTHRAQMLADDNDRANVKIFLIHFAYNESERNVWTLRVYDLVQRSWSIASNDFAAHVCESPWTITSLALLAGSVFVLVQIFGTQPRILRIMGNLMSEYTVPRTSYASPNVYLFTHRGSLMLARGTKGRSPRLDIWRSVPSNTRPGGGSHWTRVITMPKLLLNTLYFHSDTKDGHEFVKFQVDGDFICFTPSQTCSDCTKFIIFLDLVKLRWEFFTSHDGLIEGFSICQPRMEIVL